MNKLASNTIDNYPNLTTNNMNKMASNTNTIDNYPNSPLTLKEKLNKIPRDYDPNQTNFSIFNDSVKDFGTSVSNISKVFVDTGAEVATIGIKTGENAAKIEGLAAVNASVDLAATAADVAKNKLPGFIDNIKDVTKVVTEGIGEVNNVIDNTTLEMEEASIKGQIDTMMASRPGLTEEQAIMELEENERLEKEENRMELENKKIEAKIAEAAAIAKKADALETASEAKIVALSGGGSRRSTLKNIQKGGKMSAKRTQKSINDFLKPSITSSSILKMLKKGRRSKKIKYNKGLRSKRRK